ncbi:MAG: PEP-CTERM sorting domain-containing protein [Roseibacillus sp.]
MKNTFFFLTPLSLLVVGLTSDAAILAGYDFDDGTGAHGPTHDLSAVPAVFDAGTLVGTLTATVSDAQVTASSFGTGSGLSNLINLSNGNSNFSDLDAEGNVFGSANGVEFGGARNAFGFTDMNNANNLGLAITNNDYMTFSVTPDAGSQLGLSSFTFRTRSNQSGNSAERWALFSSVDGFTTGNQITAGRTTNIGTWGGATNSVVVDLSAASLQDLTGTTEFRLYIYGGNNAGSSATLFDKVILNGAVTPIPEPSSLILLGLGLSGVTFIRRRK